MYTINKFAKNNISMPKINIKYKQLVFVKTRLFSFLFMVFCVFFLHTLTFS